MGNVSANTNIDHARQNIPFAIKIVTNHAFEIKDCKY